jgi:hypothetical protein
MQMGLCYRSDGPSLKPGGKTESAISSSHHIFEPPNIIPENCPALDALFVVVQKRRKSGRGE